MTRQISNVTFPYLDKLFKIRIRDLCLFYSNKLFHQLLFLFLFNLLYLNKEKGNAYFNFFF